MDNKIAEQMTGISSQILNTIDTLQQINNKAVQSLVSKQLTGIEDLISSSSRQMQDFAQVKTPEEAVAVQLKIVNEMSEAIETHAKGNIELFNESREQMEDLVKTEVKSLVEKAKSVSV
jgi:hypothetical protein